MDAIQEKLAAWLPLDLLEQLDSCKISAAAPNTQPWVLELNLPSMAVAGHEELVNEVLANPRAVCVALWQYLASKDAFLRGSRVWLRTSMPWEINEPVPLALSLQLCAAAPSSLRSFSGAVAGISPEEEFIVDMTYGCGVCGSEERIFLPDGSSSPTCCGFPTKHANLQQLVLGRARTILLAPATSTTASSMHPTSTVAVPVVVRLRDDLANSCKPGDIITCTGIAECIAESSKCAQGRPALAQVRVEALHVLHHSAALRNYHLPDESLSLASGSLNTLITALEDWLHPPCSSLALAALLLSACSTGSASPPSTAISTRESDLFPDAECDALHLSASRGICGKNPRVNILLLTAGHDTLGNSLLSLAHALCSHVTDGSLPGSNLLPTALELSGVPSLVSSGQLGQANRGVCLLSQHLSAKHGRAVGEALRAGHVTVALPSGQTSCTVEINPTLWCVSSAPDLLPKQKPAGGKFNKFASNKNTTAPLAILFAEKSSPQLAAQFDVILDCASIEDDAAEAWADEYLATLVPGDLGEEECAARKETARRALQNHVAICPQLAPVMTSSAMGLLNSYWTGTRSAVSGGGGGSAVSAVSLETAAKLAAASARLFHRTEILDFPDATLAVALCEEGMIARGWNSVLWGPLREQMAYGRDLEECLTDLYRQIILLSKQHGWEWESHEE